MTNHVTVDPATGVTEVGYNRYVLEAVKNKVLDNILKIETTLGMNITSTYELSEHQFSLKGITDRFIRDETWIKKDANQVRTTEFRCSMFPFMLSSSSKVIVGFDEYFNIGYVQFQSSKKELSNIQIINLIFDKNLDLESIEFKSLDKHPVLLARGLRKENRLSSLADEALYFGISMAKDNELKELIPEFFVPSAYNFNTEDFSSRLNVVSMLMV